MKFNPYSIIKSNERMNAMTKRDALHNKNVYYGSFLAVSPCRDGKRAVIGIMLTRLFLLLGFFTMPFEADAETYGLIASNIKPTALDFPEKWKNSAGELCSKFLYSDNFYNEGWVLFLRTPALESGNGCFQGGSLSIGGKKKTGSAVFYHDKGSMIGFPDYGQVDNGGLVLCNGVLAINFGDSSKSGKIGGRVAVTASASSPFRITAFTPDSDLDIAADFVSGADNALILGWSHNGGKVSNLAVPACSRNFTVRLTGDCSNFLGTMTMTGSVDRVEMSDVGSAALFGSQLVLSNTTFSGSVTLNGGCILAANSPTDVCSVATLNLRPNSVLLIPGATKVAEETGFVVACTNALIHVTNTLNVEGPVCIALPGYGAVPDGMTNKFAVLTAPTGTNLDPLDFTVVAPGFDPVPYRLAVEVTQDAEILFCEVEPYVLLAGSDSSSILRSVTNPGSELPSSLNNADAWSDGELPHAGVNYVVRKKPSGEARYLRTPGSGYKSALEYKFYGRRLIIDSGCRLISHCGIFQSLDQPVRFMDGSSLAYVHSQSTKFLGGLEVGEGSFSIRPYVGGGTEVDKLYGCGTIVAGGLTIDNGSVSGSYRFENTADFTGKIDLQTSMKSAVNFSSGIYQKHFVSGNAFGGERSVFTPDAIRLSDHAVLSVDASAPTQTLANTSNGGVKVDDTGHVVLENPLDRLRIDWPVTYNGTLYKNGPGTLALGGTALFGDDSAENPVLGGISELALHEGTLEIASSDAVDGCNLSVSNGVSLVVKYEKDDERTRTYGLRNAKTPNPFVLCDVASGKLPISVDFADWGSAFPDSLEFALLSVTNLPGTVSAVKGMIPSYVKISGLEHPYRQIISESANDEEGLVIFRMKIVRAGLVIGIR